MITSNNKQWIDKMRVLSLHGLSHDAYKRYSVKHYRSYECLIPGFKYNMMDIQASLGLPQLARLEKNAKIRKKYWQMYNDAFRGIPEITLPSEEEKDTYHARHLYAILLSLENLKIDRDKFIDKLIKNNIGSGVHFNPVHLHKYYRQTFSFKKGDFPNAEFIGERIISLPLGANLTVRDVQDVIMAVKKILEFNKKKMTLKSRGFSVPKDFSWRTQEQS